MAEHGGGRAGEIEAIRARLVEHVADAVTEALEELEALGVDESEIARALCLRPTHQ